ncbi:MAG: adenylosuccinate lyase family protein [Pseudomonadota bacterium]
MLEDLYGDAEISAHLTPEAEVAAMVQVEIALARVEARLGVIPSEAAEVIAEALAAVRIAPKDMVGPTAAAGVAVPGLVAMLREAAGAHGGYVHWGATSQDIVDTGWVLRLCEVLAILAGRLDAVIASLADQAEAHAGTVMAGRTRSQIATPVTLGLRIAGWLAPLVRCRDRLAELKPRLLVVQFGGASGNLSALQGRGVEVMAGLADELALGCPEKPWHTERDGLVELANWLAMVTSLLGRMGGDLIILGRSEIAEVRAGRGGGSSTMPQKSNPVGAEALVVLARQVSGLAATLHQVLLSQEERDGTTWPLEWLTLPGMLEGTGAALRHAEVLAGSLNPAPEAMARTMALGGGAIHAEALAFELAQHMPLPEAQALIKQAVAQGGDLVAGVRRLCAERALDTGDLDLSAQTATDAALIARIVATARSVPD